MKRSHVIALAGISAALAYVSIILSFYVEIMSISFGVIAGISLMLPLTARSISGAIFAYVSASILSLLTVEPFAAMVFILFFGPWTIIEYVVDFRLYDKLNLPKWAKLLICYAIKAVFYIASVTSLYFIMTMFGNVDELFEKLMWLAIILLILIFFLYDLMIRMVFINLRNLINKRILKNVGNVNTHADVTKEDSKKDVDIFGIDDVDSTDDTHEDEPKGSDKKDDKPKDSDNIEDESSSRFKHFIDNDKD